MTVLSTAEREAKEHAIQLLPDVVSDLGELVRLYDVKVAIGEGERPMMSPREEQDYRQEKALAWSQARAALEVSPEQPEGTR